MMVFDLHWTKADRLGGSQLALVAMGKAEHEGKVCQPAGYLEVSLQDPPELTIVPLGDIVMAAQMMKLAETPDVETRWLINHRIDLKTWIHVAGKPNSMDRDL